MRTAALSVLCLAAAAFWGAAFRSDVDRGWASLPVVDEGAAVVRKQVGNDSSSTRSRRSLVESELQRLSQQRSLLLADRMLGGRAEGAAGHHARPGARRVSIDTSVSDEAATSDLLHQLAAELRGSNARGTLTSVHCDRATCRATLEFSDIAEAVRYADAASRDGRWRQVEVTGDDREDLELTVYVERGPPL